MTLAKDRVGIGILSHAHGHANVYCREMLGFDDVELVATWDDNEERGRAAAAEFGMEFRPRAADVVEDPRIDAVIVTMETNRHADFCEMAAAAGKAILCQKPLATTLADCDRIIAAVQKYGVKFSVAYQMRYDPVNRKIKELVDSGAVGRVAVVRRRHCINVLLNPGFVNGPTRWHFDPQANIGMFFDDASHAADWFYWMMGDPVSVMAEVDNVVTDVSPDDNGVAVYRFRNGEMGILLNSSTTVAAVATTEIYGDAGTIVQDYGDGPATSAPRAAGAIPLRMIRQGDAEWTEFPLPIPASQGDRIAAVPRPFIDYVRGLSQEWISAEEGRKSVEMVLGVYKSAIEGRRVTFPLGED
ncbi:MAG: Gfo/Idh/MocA family oxidoreductase [Lentisphaerae bacterium]|nr:Gfo/Idh/MocA family oxidoreductase [Lentisphaerota bacterium]